MKDKEILRILVGALALFIGGAVVITELLTTERQVNPATVGLAAAFTTTAAMILGGGKST